MEEQKKESIWNTDLSFFDSANYITIYTKEQ